MRFAFAIATLLFLAEPGWTQSNWAPAGMPFDAAQIRCLYYDEVEDVLWVGGDIRDGTPNDQVLLKYNGTIWTAYGHFDNQVLAITRFQDKIIVGGFFTEFNGTLCSKLACLEGDEFVEFGGGADGTITMLDVIDDTLYAGGNFNTIGSLETKMIAKWDGENWFSLDGFPEVGDGDIASAIVQFGDELFVGGNYGPLWEEADIYYHTNGEWIPAGGGIQGGISDVREMSVYNDELIIGGAIYQSAGNAGHSIQKWNGFAWEELGGSLTGANFSNSQFTPLQDMDVYNGKLYIAGAFENAGDIHSPYFTVWDGEKYCALGGEFTGYGGGGELEFFQDTLYVACRDSVDGQFVNNLAKYVGDWYLEPCSTVGVVEAELLEAEISIWPNPTNKQLNIESINSISEIEISDLTGRTVSINHTISTQTQLSLANLSNGFYFLTATFANGNMVTRKFLKE